MVDGPKDLRNWARRRTTPAQRGEEEYRKAMEAALNYLSALRSCIDLEYRCRKTHGLREGEPQRKELLEMLATRGLLTALREIPAEKAGMLDQARDLRRHFHFPLHIAVTWASGGS